MNKKRTIFLITIFTSLLACSNANKKIDHEQIKFEEENISETTQKFMMKKYIIPNELSTDSQYIVDNIIETVNWLEKQDSNNFDPIIKKNDIILAGHIQDILLKQKSLKQVDTFTFLDRIKYVFGIDLNSRNLYLHQNEKFVIYAKLNTYNECNELNSDSIFFTYRKRKNLVFFKNEKIITTRIPLSTDYITSDSDSEIKIEISEEDFHENNYVLNNSKSSLTWLLVNDTYFIEDLFREFAYDKEPRINKFILDNIYKEYKNNSEENNNEIFFDVFVHKGCDGKLKLKENLYQFISSGEDNENDYAYIYMMYDYARSLMYDTYAFKDELQFNDEDRFKIITYLGYYIQQYYDKYQNEENLYQDIHIPGALKGSLFRNYFVSHPSLLEHIRKNNYYNIDGLDSIIDSVLRQIDFETNNN